MLKKLFGGKPAAVEDEAPAEETPEPVSLPPTLGFVTHQAIYDAQLRMVGYEFMVRDAQARRGDVSAGQHAQFDSLMLSTLLNLDVFRLLPRRLVFINLSPETLFDTQLANVPTGRVVCVLNPVGGGGLAARLPQRVAELKQAGWRFAMEPALFDGRVGSVELVEALLAQMEVLIQDFAAPHDEVLRPFLDNLPGRYPQARWYVRNVNSVEAYEVCQKAAGGVQRFALFHGTFMTQFRAQPDARADASQLRVLEIMRMVRAGASGRELEEKFKQDSVLLFRLLRFINSPVNGLQRKIQSIEDSLLLLGRETLFKWLTLLLYTSRKDDGRSVALLERSLARARFLESMAAAQGKNRLESEHLFLTGVFSTLDALLQLPLREALEPLELPVPVADALLVRRGLFVPYLDLCLSLEEAQEGKVEPLARALGMSTELVNQLETQAMVWAEQIVGEMGVGGD